MQIGLRNVPTCLQKNIIKLRFSFDILSRKVAAPRVSPEGSFVPPKADCFPSYPIHTKENQYKADKKDDTEDDCEKNFNSAASISGGIATISCNHKITKERDPKKNYEYLDICPN